MNHSGHPASPLGESVALQTERRLLLAQGRPGIRQRLLGGDKDIEWLPRLGHVGDAGREFAHALARLP
jgi:hypothetical protein